MHVICMAFHVIPHAHTDMSTPVLRSMKMLNLVDIAKDDVFFSLQCVRENICHKPWLEALQIQTIKNLLKNKTNKQHTTSQEKITAHSMWWTTAAHLQYFLIAMHREGEYINSSSSSSSSSSSRRHRSSSKYNGNISSNQSSYAKFLILVFHRMASQHY